MFEFAEESDKETINITSEIQFAFTAYHVVFGTKIIDFNAENSPF
jgi:hypothetical protein